MLQNSRNVLYICAKYMMHYKSLHVSNFFVQIFGYVSLMVCFYVILSNIVCHSFYHPLILNLVNPRNLVQASLCDSCLFDYLL